MMFLRFTEREKEAILKIQKKQRKRFQNKKRARIKNQTQEVHYVQYYLSSSCFFNRVYDREKAEK